MIHIIVPACGPAEQFGNTYWPKNIIEVCGKPMIQHVIENYAKIPDKRFIFILNQQECNQFHTDNIVDILTEGNCDIIRLEGDTKGALCTCLMSVALINNEDSILITNNDQKFDCNLNTSINYFQKIQADAGVLCFDCIHPRWSYIRTEHDYVIEAAEKRPISRHAIAGVYYFRHGYEFVESAKDAIIKESTYNGQYYLSAALNQMILKNKKIGYDTVPGEVYHSFYSTKRIEIYEQESRR